MGLIGKQQSDWTVGEGIALVAQLSGLPPEMIEGFTVIVALPGGTFGFVTDPVGTHPPVLLARLMAAVKLVAEEA